MAQVNTMIRPAGTDTLVSLPSHVLRFAPARIQQASVAELVDALDSKSSAERRAGSIPAGGTKNMNYPVLAQLKTRILTKESGFFVVSLHLIRCNSIATRYRHFWRYLQIPMNTYRHYEREHELNGYFRPTG
jgi:hypothetical protein